MRESRNIGRPGAVTAGVLLMLLAIPSVAAGAVRYAEPGGDGPEPCLIGDPCDIQIAVEGTVLTDVDDGDEVILLPGPGDYMVGADPIEVTDDIELHGQDAQPRPLIVSTAPAALSTNNTGDALISDLEIEHSGAGAALSFAVSVERVEATTSDGYACTPYYASTIRDSVCRSTGGGISAGLAVGSNGPTTFDVRAVNVTAIGGHFGIVLDAGGGSNLAIHGSNVIAQGGTFDVSADAQDMDPGTDADIPLDHSNYETREVLGAQASVTAAGSGTNQTADPLFANPLTDFHQLAGSPTRNAGGTNADLGTLDLDRQPRDQGLAPDIGADEFSEATIRCAGQRATAVGTTGRDRIRGSAGRDVIASLGGKDIVRGLRGKDLICGGRGRDRLFGGPGRDRLLGQAGRDLLRGGPGRDRLRGGPGRDTQVQ